MGKIELDHTGSGGGITLSSDGTDLLLDGTAIGGGGGADLYAANDVSATAPSATGDNSVAIGDSSTAAGLRSTAIGYSHASGTMSFAAAIGNSSQYRGAQAQYAIAIGNNAYVQANDAAAYGYYATIGTSGTRAVSLGHSYANGNDSFSAVIDNNTSSYGATGANSVAMGYQAKATNSYAFAVGQNNVASGFGTVAIGRNSTASRNYSITLGTQAISSIDSKMAFSGGRFSTDGDAQTGTFVLRSDTTDATAEALTTSNGTASTTNQIILPNNSAYAFHGTIVARESATDGTDCAAWKIEGLIRREGSAGTTTLVNSATTVLDNTPSWGMALSADTTNGGLKVEVTGAAATNIRWVATIHTSEVTYA